MAWTQILPSDLELLRENSKSERKGKKGVRSYKRPHSLERTEIPRHPKSNDIIARKRRRHSLDKSDRPRHAGRLNWHLPRCTCGTAKHISPECDSECVNNAIGKVKSLWKKSAKTPELFRGN